MSKNPYTSIVTGAAGFLGSHVVDLLLKNKHHVIAIDNLSNGTWDNLSHWSDEKLLERHNLDIRSLSQDHPLFRNIDYVFHLAGQECDLTSLHNPEPFFETNVQGSLKVLQASLQSQLKAFVFASSSSIYGNAQTPTLEKDRPNPQSPSALSKHMAEQSIFHWGHLYGFKAISLRIFNAYGPRSVSSNFPGNEFTQLMSHKFNNSKAIILGSESQERDFIFCTDVANAFLTAAEEGSSQALYNIGSGKSFSLYQLCTLLKLKREVLPVKNIWPQKSWADISKFQFDCNWQPRVPFESGIQFSLDVLPAWKDSKRWGINDLEKLIHPLRKKCLT
jgi:UDP-glucose 4-epimerase